MMPWNKGKKMPEISGKNHYLWKDNVGLAGVHMWLSKNYGNASKCENKKCLKKSSLFEWSLKKGKEYKKIRSNFWMLCRSCHRKYDWNEKKTKKALKNLHWYRS